MRHRGFDRAAQAAQLIRQIRRPQRSARRHHAAAYVHAHRRRDDGAAGGNHAAYGGALAQMHVRHHRQVFVDEGQLRGLQQLSAGGFFHRHALRPHFDSCAIGRLQSLILVHGLFSFLLRFGQPGRCLWIAPGTETPAHADVPTPSSIHLARSVPALRLRKIKPSSN